MSSTLFLISIFHFVVVQTEWNHHRIQNIPPHPRPGLEEERPEEGRSSETGIPQVRIKWNFDKPQKQFHDAEEQIWLFLVLSCC